MTIKIVAVLPVAGEIAKKQPDYLICVENCIGLEEFAKKHDWGDVDIQATADKEGDDCELERLLPDADILVTTPFHPAYMTRKRIEKAKKLKLLVTCGVGSDHIDLHASADKGLTVAEITGSNVESVAEDEVMRMLIFMRNFLPGYHQIINGEWDVPKVACKCRDMKEKVIGTVGGGRIGREVMKRLKPWDVKLTYYARHDKKEMDEMGVELVKDFDKFLAECDIITINVPLTDKTRGMFNKEVFDKMKHGAYLVNNARGSIVNREDVVEALKSGQLGGYGGDVWDEQPPPKDHPWRTMPNHAMTPHISGTSLDAQKRCAAGTLQAIDCYLKHKPFPEDWYIVREGKLAEAYT